MIMQGADVEQHPNIKHSCPANPAADPNLGYGDPAVRIQQWVDAFGANGVFQSICEDNFAPALRVIANKVAGVFGPACVDGPFPATAAGTQPTCRVVDRVIGGSGQRTDTLLPRCADNGDVAPCWTLSDDVAGCLDGKRLAINRGTVTPPADLTTAFTCAPCAPGSTEIGCR
jgi:hypothetical protein